MYLNVYDRINKSGKVKIISGKHSFNLCPFVGEVCVDYT